MTMGCDGCAVNIVDELDHAAGLPWVSVVGIHAGDDIPAKVLHERMQIPPICSPTSIGLFFGRRTLAFRRGHLCRH